MLESLFSEALVHAARKRAILDRAQAARLHVLLHAHHIYSPDAARAWIMSSGLLPSRLAKPLLERLPPAGQAPYGQYVPLVHLADGGMGSVYLAAAPAGELVVIKTMRANLSDNQEVVKRFERESRFMMTIKHPNIVTCLDAGQAASGELYLVLEFVPSGDLKELTTQHNRLDEAIALGMVYQIADALGEAHRHHVVHRDIKPPNVFVSYEGRAKLADFGIARSTSDQRTMLTMQGALVGSPYYMSPEQVMAESDIDIRSDIYAIGAMLYYCLSGAEPYRGSLHEVLHAHRTAPIPDVRTLRPEIGSRTAGIITRCLQKERDQRYADPAALRAAVLSAMAELETPGAPGLLPSTANQATITVDFAEAALPDTTATITASAAGADEGAGAITIATPAAGFETIAVHTAEWADSASLSGSFHGDLTSAITAPWIALIGTAETIILYALPHITLGKLCEPPVDICLRKYPIAQFHDDCLRISRQHLRIGVSANGVQVTDLGSGNGTSWNGQPLAMNTPTSVAIGGDHRLVIARALTLNLHAYPSVGAATLPVGISPKRDAVCGLECGLPVDAITLTRVENRSAHRYVLVQRRVTLGSADLGAMVPVSDAPSVCEIAYAGGHWLWRASTAHDPWLPLTLTSVVNIGSKQLTVRLGGYDLFL